MEAYPNSSFREAKLSMAPSITTPLIIWAQYASSRIAQATYQRDIYTIHLGTRSEQVVTKRPLFNIADISTTRVVDYLFPLLELTLPVWAGGLTEILSLREVA